MEWYFTYEQGINETQIPLPIYVDILWIQNVFQNSKTPIFIVINI